MAGSDGGMTGGHDQVTSFASIILAVTSLGVGFINAIVFALKTRAEQDRLDREVEIQRERYLERIAELEAFIKETHRAASAKAGLVALEVSRLGSRVDASEAETERLSRRLAENQLGTIPENDGVSKGGS